MNIQKIENGRPVINNRPNNMFVKILLAMFIIAAAYTILLSALSYQRTQSLLNKSEVVSLIDRVKKRYPECNKVADVKVSYPVGDSSYEDYILQLDQSSGCQFKKIRFSRLYGSNDEFSMSTDKESVIN